LLARADLRLRILLVVVAQGSHRRASEEFADVAEEALAIVMTSGGPERDRRVAEVTNRLAIGNSPEMLLRPGPGPMAQARQRKARRSS
jgi:hypothetical protein